MPTKGKKKITFEEELAALTPAAANPGSAEARATIAAALVSSRSLVVARAARLIKEHTLTGFEAALRSAFERFMENPTKSDPGCSAKLAAIEALDQVESSDPAPFARASRHVQQEGSSDMAAPLRARAIAGLARLGHPDFQLMAAHLIADRWPPVRQAALEALAHRGDAAGAALALLKLELGDEDPLVTLAAMTTLVTLAPECGLTVLGALLDERPRPSPSPAGAMKGERPGPREGDGSRRELAAVALGQSRREDALALLLDRLHRCPRAEERQPLVQAIGLHRSEQALAAMLDIIADAKRPEAVHAVEALAARRFEPGLAERVKKAARRRDEADLDDVVDPLFGGSGG